MKRQFLFFTFFFIFFTTIGLSQNNTSSLNKLAFTDLKQLFFKNENNKSKQLQILNVYLNKAKKSDSTIYLARAYYMHSLLNEKQKAISYLDSVIKYSRKTNDKFFPLSAYREKAYILRHLYKYDEAIQNYILAENLAKKTNLDFYYKVKLDIAELKSEELEDVEEALNLYRECLNYYKKQTNKKDDYFYCYNQTLFDLADAHKTLKKTDSATYYNRLGYRNSAITKDNQSKFLFVLNEGANLILIKKYNIAIDSINKALPKMIEYHDKMNIIAGYYYLGKANEGLGKNNLALNNFIKVDSLYQIYKEIYPEMTDGYNYLIDYYKSIGNKESQLKYTTTLMGIDSTSQKKYRKLDKVIRKKYEIPHLLQNEESIIQNLKGKNKIAFWSILTLLIVALGLGIYSYYQSILNKSYKLRFEKLIVKSNTDTIKSDNEIKFEQKEAEQKEGIGIAEGIIESVLQKLIEFENKKEFLNPNVSIQSLAQEFETNTRYVSKIINVYKQKSFSQYINDLRIECAVKTLQEDSKLRKYTINALANEFGFNTAESFSGAFYKKTGIKPSFFIKELEITNS